MIVRFLAIALLSFVWFVSSIPSSVGDPIQCRLGVFDHWEAVWNHDTNTCFIISFPIKQEFRRCRDGKNPSANCPLVDPNTIRRDEKVFSLVTRVDEEKQVPSISLGYPLTRSIDVTVRIGQNTFYLFTDGETAWMYENRDQELVEAIRNGSEMVVSGISTRGTYTIDTYSLIGSQKALDHINRICRNFSR